MGRVEQAETGEVKRILGAAAAAALCLPMLTACGDHADDAGGTEYCKDLEAARTQLDSIRNGDVGSLRGASERTRDLAAEAPEELEADWKVLADGVERIVAAIEDAGLSEGDLAGLGSGEVPDGVDMDTLRELEAELQALRTPEFQKATEDIGKHAKQECGVDLGI
jgi:hypothetical protein